MDGTTDNNLPDNNETPSHWGRGFIVLLLAFIGIFALYIFLKRRRQNRANQYMGGEATLPLYDPLHPFSSDDDFELNAYDFEGNIPSGIGDLKLHSLEDRQTDENLNDNAEDILKWAEENV